MKYISYESLLFSETSDFLRCSPKSTGVNHFSPLMYLFFDQNITFFASSFIAMLRTINLFFVFKNKNYCYFAASVTSAPLAC